MRLRDGSDGFLREETCDATQGAAEAGDGADDVLGENFGREGHVRPGGVAEHRNTEERNRPGGVGDVHYEHKAGGNEEGAGGHHGFAGAVEVPAERGDEGAGDRAAGNVAKRERRKGERGSVGERLEVEVVRVLEIFGNPRGEEIGDGVG